MKLKPFLIPVFAIAIITACEKNNGTDISFYTDVADCGNFSDGTNTYELSVKAILDNYCAYSGCHNTASRKDGVILDTYSGARESFLHGKALCTINHDCTPMPEGGSKLSNATISQLTCWAKNECPE